MRAVWESDLPHEDIHAMSRLYNHSIGRRMPITGGKREGEVGDDKSKHDLQLDHGEVLADAEAISHSKGHVGLWELAGFRHTLTEPLWFELISVWSPDIGVSVQCWDQSPQTHPFGNVEVSYLDVSVGLP